VPLLLLLALLLFVVVFAIVLLPLSLLQRYRVGSARRVARGWFVGLNLAAVAISTVMFLGGAAVTTVWVPGAFTYSLLGLFVGLLLGLAGLALTRWERTPGGLLYTPNRYLVLFVTLIVTARILYGVWRSWHLASAGFDAWSEAFGVARAMGVGAVVLGYYLAYWLGIRRRLNRFRLSPVEIPRPRTSLK
jgi:hypothetical protein